LLGIPTTGRQEARFFPVASQADCPTVCPPWNSPRVIAVRCPDFINPAFHVLSGSGFEVVELDFDGR